jgi:hypothetical protein
MACTVDSDRVSILATLGSSTKICFMATSQSLCLFFGSLRIESFARTTPVAPEPVTAAIATYPFPEMPLAALSLTEFSASTTEPSLASATVSLAVSFRRAASTARVASCRICPARRRIRRFHS